MLRIKFFALALLTLILAQSCTREVPVAEQPPVIGDPLIPVIPNEVVMNHYGIGELAGQLINLNDTFVLNNKNGAAPLSYTYRAYAEPVTFPTLGGGNQTLSASAIFSINDMVFVTWHTTQTTYGGAICAYKQSGIGRYTFMDRVDFPEASYFELSASTNNQSGYYEIFMAGRRDPSSSNYVLADHRGAVVTRIDYDFFNDEFWESSAEELPLPGFAAKDIVAAAAHYFVITGNGAGTDEGGLFQIDRSMSVVEKGDLFNIDDGIAVIVDPTTQLVTPGSSSSADVYTVDRSGSDYRIKKASISYDYTSDQTNFIGLSSYSQNGAVVMATSDGERGDLTWAQGSSSGSATDSLIMAAGADGIFSNGASSGADFNAVANFGPCLSTEFDPGSGLLYYADASDGVKVLAMGGYVANAGAGVNLYDVIGNFVPPTSASGNTNLPTSFYIKEIALYRSRNIALATGDAGVYFLQKNKD
jgi:hypothetical protein